MVCNREIPENSKILNWKFVFTIEDKGKRRAGKLDLLYKDEMKRVVSTWNSGGRLHPMTLLVGLASSFGFKLNSSEVTQAFVQSKKHFI